ncbi:MAG: hypothetical protein MHPSP_002524, partial [Paramarteilia canceri]
LFELEEQSKKSDEYDIEKIDQIDSEKTTIVPKLPNFNQKQPLQLNSSFSAPLLESPTKSCSLLFTSFIF